MCVRACVHLSIDPCLLPSVALEESGTTPPVSVHLPHSTGQSSITLAQLHQFASDDVHVSYGAPASNIFFLVSEHADGKPRGPVPIWRHLERRIDTAPMPPSDLDLAPGRAPSACAGETGRPKKERKIDARAPKRVLLLSAHEPSVAYCASLANVELIDVGLPFEISDSSPRHTILFAYVPYLSRAGIADGACAARAQACRYSE